MMMRKELGFH